MSLYGALFSGVSGLKAQSTSIAVISDNISNTNTIGYKRSGGIFQTLVTTSGGGTAYSPGGVLGGSRKLVSQQGLLQATNSPTDIAISGKGMFVVNTTSDGTGQVLYTRSGSFTQDATGNFRNSSGFFLQAWPLDREGHLPGDPLNTENTNSAANLTSLRTVNVQNLTGAAAATTRVSIGANLRSSESIFAGSGLTMSMDATDGKNANNKASDIIIEQGTGVLDGLTRADSFVIATDENPTGITFTYGGFTAGRSVTGASGVNGDYGSAVLGATADGEFTIAASSGAGTGITVPDSSNVATINFSSAHGLQTGDVIAMTGPTGGVGSLTAADLTGTFVVTRIDNDTVTIVAKATNGAGGANPDLSGATAAVDIRPFDENGNIMDAAASGTGFLSSTGTSIFATAALSFTITTLTTGTKTFTYNSAPSAELGQFSNLENLVDAINAVDGLTARIDTATGQIYIGAIDATETITFANGKATGTEGDDDGEALYGIDWIRELGLSSSVTGVANQFCTMQGLADLVNAVSGLTATISSPLSDSSLFINVDDPLGTITFTDSDYGGSPDNVGSPLAALGLEGFDPLGGSSPGTTGNTSGAQGPAYSASDATKNMAAGAITPQFSRSIRVFDSLGTGHDLSVAFIKTAINTWAVEVFAIDPTEVTATNGLLASGTIIFNGDGSLQTVSSGLSNDISVSWATSGAEDSTFTINWGTAGATGVGKSDGLSQFNSNYKVSFANQNGAPVGELTGVSIDADGFVTAAYSNGETQRLFKIPLADFSNPDELQGVSGNVFSQTTGSGEVNLVEAGSSGVGEIAASSLEASNVELADELTTMIVAQRAYQANTKIIQTADRLLDELNRAIS